MTCFISIAAITIVCDARAQGVGQRSTLGDGKLTLFRPVTNERASFDYRNEDGSYDAIAMDKIARFFRCRMTGQTHPIDPQLIEILDSIEDHFEGHSIKLVSAYRSPTRNSVMRRSGRRVANNSLHMSGMAADIAIVGVPSYKVRNFAYSLGAGGVGYYRRRPFVHVDIGQMRTWGWNPAPTHRTRPAMSSK
jgi:uncharacterized protein YcbK (DUF882 family)